MAKKSILNSYVLLDRSGSMAARWTEALGAINSYVEKLDKNVIVTVATFDASDKLDFEVIRDSVEVKEWKPITNKDAQPRGTTPLFDAIGRVATLAETADNKKTVILIMTDGHENSSKEINKQEARTIIDRLKSKKWEVIFLGADFDAFGEASNVGVGINKTLNITRGNYTDSMASLGLKTMAYATLDCAIGFTEDDRYLASKKNK